MGKSAAAAKAKTPDRRALSERLVGLRIKYGEVFSEIESLKASLIELATEAGPFREVFANGQVSVAGCKDPEFQSHKPEVDPKIFQNLSETKRRKIIEAGIVRIVAVYSRRYYGRCEVRTF